MKFRPLLIVWLFASRLIVVVWLFASRLIAGLALFAATGCNRNKQEAIILMNEGVKFVDTQPGDAIQKFEEAAKLDPSNHHILYELAKAYKKKDDYEKAQSALQRAVEKAPGNANYWFELGFAIEMQAKKVDKDKPTTVKWKDAIDPYSKCVEKDPNDDRCYYHLGLAYYWSDDEQKALQSITDAIEHRPVDSDAVDKAAAARAQSEGKKPPRSERQKCVDDLMKECALNRYTTLAHLYIILDYLKEAEQVLNAAKDAGDPKDRRLYNVYTLLADVAAEQRDPTKEVAALEAARGLREDEPGLLLNLGMAYAELNPPKKAEALARLKGFTARACTKDAGKYKRECEQAQTVIQKLSGPSG